MDNYIRSFVEKLLYKVGCKLIDEIADQIMKEDDDDEDASQYELRSKRKSYRNKPTEEGTSNDAPIPPPASTQ